MSGSDKGWKDSNWYVSLSSFLREYRKHKIGLIGVIIMFSFFGMAIFAPNLGTSDPNPLKAIAPPYLAPSFMNVFDTQGVVTDHYLSVADMNEPPRIHVNGSSGEFSAEYGQDFGTNATNHVNLTWSHTAGTQLDFYDEDPEDTMPDYGDFVYFDQKFEWPWNGLPTGINMSVSLATFLTGDFAPDVIEGNNLMFRLYVWFVDSNDNWYKVYETDDSTYTDYVQTRRIPLSFLTNQDIFEGLITVNGTQTSLNDTLTVRVGLAPYRNFEDWSGTTPWQDYTGTVTFTVTGVDVLAFGGYYGILGTTTYGADAWSQLIYGSRISLIIGLLATALSTIVGVIVGITAGYFGGRTDEILMRFVDFLLVIPGLPLMMVLAIFLGESTQNIIIVIAILGWTGTARLIRSQVLAEKNKAYVESARAIGANDTYIMFRHILPNVTPILFANITLGVVGAILSEAGLSFLGLTDIEEPSWGRMLADAQNGAAFIRGAWWVVLFPGLMITLLSLSFTFVGHTLDQVLNPRLRER